MEQILTNESPSYLTYVSSWQEGGQGQGIGIYEWFPEKGLLEPKSTVTEVSLSNYLALDAQRLRLYSINEEGIQAFAIDPSSGDLTLLNQVPLSGRGGCYLSISNDGKYLLAAYYSSGSFASYQLHEDGSIGEEIQVTQHDGSGPNPERQEAAHAHMILPAPAGDLIFVPDLGIDKVTAYNLDTMGKFSPAPAPFAALDGGYGPRHLAFHPTQPYAYVLAELTSQVVGFTFDSSQGLTKKINDVSMLPDDFKEFSKAADIHITPDGRFLYASNRGHDSIAIMAISETDGSLTLVDIVPCGGSWPRAFEIDPSGQFLLVANKRSNSISIQSIDLATGLLKVTATVPTVAAPQCIRFLKTTKP